MQCTCGGSAKSEYTECHDAKELKKLTSITSNVWPVLVIYSNCKSCGRASTHVRPAINATKPKAKGLAGKFMKKAKKC